MRVDRHRVLQILINLLRNAKCALDDVAAHRQADHGLDRAWRAKSVHVVVKDNGIGISQENLARRFLRMASPPARTATGFGLHSGALAAQEMGGSLQRPEPRRPPWRHLHSRTPTSHPIHENLACHDSPTHQQSHPGRSTITRRFVKTFARVTESGRSAPCRGNSTREEAALSAKLTALRASLTFQVDSAFQGQEGLEKVRAAVAAGAARMPSHLSDVRMPPGWDGVEAITRIWAEFRDLQIVICTAYSDYSWDEISEAIGNTDQVLVLKRPFDNIEVSPDGRMPSRKSGSSRRSPSGRWRNWTRS